jgi:hypothetical protein
MKVLLLHPKDKFSKDFARGSDLVVDLARAPRLTYERWARDSGGRVTSLDSFREPIADLHLAKHALALDSIHLFDGQGIDWWSLASYLVVDGLLESVLLRRLAKQIAGNAELFCTRPDARAEFLRILVGGNLTYISSAGTNQTIRHYLNVFSRLDRAQILQVLQDKWDPQHRFRRRMGHRVDTGKEPVVLLPSAYVNISRTAIAYAKLLPAQRFLLVYARTSGRISGLPPNVQAVPLHPYYDGGNPSDLPDLLSRWQDLNAKLGSSSEELRGAERLGAMKTIPDFIARGASARDAWNRVFESHNVVACLSADDTNAYTRIPLLLARRRGLSAVACHHGALDYRMAVKTPSGTAYLAKSEMEKDYLENVCRVSQEIVLAGPASAQSITDSAATTARPWMVLFTEPYEADGWRIEEVYRDLLPPLLNLAHICHLRLIIKLHPFESSKEHRKLHAKLLSKDQIGNVEIVEEPLSPKGWSKVNFALTVQSSVALECKQRNIPIFLLGWLHARYGGYLEQFAKFGAGQILMSAEDLATVPDRLAGYEPGNVACLGTEIAPSCLQQMLGSRKAVLDG